MESIVQFPNNRGETLRGILHYPMLQKSPNPKRIVVFPNGGVMGAEGDYRAHLHISRLLSQGGYHVLRFSPAGLGASDGDIADCRIKNLYNQIENGLLVDDIKAAITYVRTVDKYSTITLSGICGGAITSFLAAADIREVDCVIPIGIPVVLDGDEHDYIKRIMALDKQYVLKMYLSKVFSLKAWGRMLLRKSDVKTIRGVVLALFKRKQSYIGGNAEKTKFTQNPLFFEAGRKIFGKKKVLFVFGDTDGFWWEFQNLFLKTNYREFQNLPFDIYVSSMADHMLSLREMQIDVARAMLAWMDKNQGLVS